MTNLAHALFNQARERPDKAALHFGLNGITFAEVRPSIQKTAVCLAAAGITANTRVGLFLAWAAEFIVAQQALFALDAYCLPELPKGPRRQNSATRTAPSLAPPSARGEPNMLAQAVRIIQ